jgi:polysaccharide export outer membrane protein
MKTKEIVMRQVCCLVLATCFFSIVAMSQAPGINSLTRGKTGGPSPNDKASQLSPKSDSEKDYVIGPEDVLSIVVWHEPELSTKVTVRSDGKIALTLLDEVQAGGLTPIQLKEQITIGLKRFLNDPQVYVIPLEIHSQFVYIVGSVAKPGIYPLGTSMRVTELLVRAGGLVEFAKSEEIVIVRREEGMAARFPFNYKRFLEGKGYQQDVLLRSGDMVVVP